MTNIQSALNNLSQSLSPEQVITDPVQLLAYEMDASLMDRGMPDGVVLPRTIDDVVTLARWSHRHKIPLIARASGTGLAGAAVAHQGGVVVAFSRLNAILELDETGRRALVETNVVNQKLAGLAHSKGLYFPPDPSSGRTSAIGGNIGTNAGGPHCFKYGVTSNYITGVQLVLADGRQMQFGGNALDYPEYDLVALMVGSEGTLGLITAAHLRLIRNPPGVKTLMAAFETVEMAGQAVSAIIAGGLVPATLEMMDRQIIRIVEDFAQPGLPTDAGAILILEVDGYPQSLSPQIDEISALLQQYEVGNLKVARSAAEREKIWYARKSAAGALSRLAPAYYLVDGTVPRSQLAQTLDEINRICQKYQVQVGYVFHAGDGNLHPLILIPDPADTALVERVYKAGKETMQICVDKDGSITGEHGVGLEKRDYMPMMYNPIELGVMQDIKDIFDPDNLLNPGKVLPLNIREAEAGEFANLPMSEPAKAPERGTSFAPASTEEAAGALRALSGNAQSGSVRIRGGGTKSVLLPAADILLSTEKLSGIKTYARDDFYVTVGAGTSLAALQQELSLDKMWVPLVSPWADATVGGIVATNFNAPLRMRYGSIRDLVLAVTVVLPDGRTIRAGRPVVKNVAGYDLPKLFAGAYGTLGLVTEVTLKISPLPRIRAGLVIPVDALQQGLAWGMALSRVCLVTSALLLTGGDAVPGGTSPYALVFTAEGLPEDVTEEINQARAVLSNNNAPSPDEALSEIIGAEMWATWLGKTTPLDTVLRLGVGPKHLSPTVSGVLSATGDASFIADLPNGMLYLKQAQPALDTLRRIANQAGGYSVMLSGPPNIYAPAQVWGYSPDGLEIMRAIKNRWDQRGYLNPGAFI